MFKHLLDNRPSIYLLPLIGGVFIVVLSLTVVIPKAREIPVMRETITTGEIRLAKLEKKLQLLESVEAGPMQQYLTDAILMVPNDKDVSSIITTLENTVLSSGVTLDSIDLNPGIVSTESAVKETQPETKAETGARTISISTVIRGTTDQFKDFVAKLHTVKRIFDIQSVKVTYLNDQPDNILEANLSLTAYFLPPVTQIGGVETELPPISQAEQVLLQKLAAYPDFSTIIEATDGGSLSNEPIGKADLFNQ